MAMLQSMLMQVQAAENGRSLLQSTMMVQTSTSRSTTLLKEGVPSEDNLERLHSEARKRLNEVTEIAAQDDADEVYCIGDTFRWKDYIAWHDDCNEILGTGIIAAHLEKYAAQQIIIEQTMPELITCSTDPTTRIAECIPAPNAKTMHN